MAAKTPRYVVAKLDFGRGYVIFDNASGREIKGTRHARRRDAAAHARRMNSRTREAK